MAQNAYAYPRSDMPIQYEPQSQAYSYPVYSQQQTHPQQMYAQPAPTSVYAHPGNAYSAHDTRLPLPAPATASPQPIAYGHPPQRPYAPYSPQSSYAPFDPRNTSPHHITPSLAPLSRRPLPDPARMARSNSVSSYAIPPQPPRSPGPRTPAHRPTLSVSSLPTVPVGLTSPTSPRAPQPMTTSASPPRPLPQPSLPRSVGQLNLAQSMSPSMRAEPLPSTSATPDPAPRRNTDVVLPPAMPPGQKFVPHWKRALPTPGPPVERRGTVSGPAPTPPPPTTSGMRPLPTSPVRSQTTYAPPSSSVDQTGSTPRRLPQPRTHMQSPTQGSPDSSDDDDIAGSALLSRPPGESSRAHASPQYGICDLPTHLPADSSATEPRPAPRNGRSQSVSAVPISQQHQLRWPTGLPPLPRAPGTPAALESLDDAPPRSLRRSPSPTVQPPQSPTRRAPPATIRTHELARAQPMLQESPVSGLSDSSVFTLSAFPRPPSSGALASASVSPVRSSPNSADSAGSVISLSSFPQPPAPAVIEPPPRNESLNRMQGDRALGAGRQPIPKVSFPASADSDSGEDSDGGGPGVPAILINVDGDSNDGGFVIRVAGADDDDGLPSISIGGADDGGACAPQLNIGGVPRKVSTRSPLERVIRKGAGLTCGGCGGAIVGRTVYAMGAKWHPGCFRCCVCDALLENLSSYEHDGRAYCNLDYHELFAPKCYHCKTAIIDERFITLDDAELGKRTYHEQHFFCSECGDPFLDPKGSPFRRRGGGQTFTGDGDFGDGEGNVRFTVYRGYPYCEDCHVRLRLPKCKKCRRPIRDGARAVEALGGKWCWECFTCASCDKPFEDPSFFHRDGKPFCERCFSIMIKNEM